MNRPNYSDLKDFMLWLHDNELLSEHIDTTNDCSCELYEYIEGVVLNYLNNDY